MSEDGAVGARRRVVGITLPTPWFPTPFNRMSGSFVAEYARLVQRIADGVHVVHAQEWPGGTGAAAEALRPAFDTVLTRLAAGGGLVVPGAAGSVTRVPVFTAGGVSLADRAEAMVRDVRRAVGRFETPIVHGHVGYWGGLIATRLADPDARVFATEHSSGLRDLLATPGGRRVYAEVLERCTRVFCVSNLLREQVLDVLPEYPDRLEVLPNPVEFHGVPQRSAPPERLASWAFVGALGEHKGVERLVRAFCRVAREVPQVELTLYGDGPLAPRLRELAAGAGVGDRLHLRGVVRHGELLAALPRHDVLFAPSVFETFHLAVVEAVAAGVPVIVTRSGGPQEALAGVEDRVGRFVDVADSPDELVDAWRDLSASLDSLDLDSARKELDARYGPEAVLARLRAAYTGGSPGGSAGGSAGAASLPQVPALPERVVLVAASAWRRYSVEAELDAVRRLGVPAVVVTGDPQVTSWAAGLRVVGPAGVALPAAGAAPAVPARPLAVRLRRAAGRLRRRLSGRPAALPPRSARLDLADLRGATVVVTDCQSMPLAERLLAAEPTARGSVELPRSGVLGPPPDARDDVARPA